MIRIATGLLLLWSVGCLGFDLHGFLGSGGWADQDALAEVRHTIHRWEWSLWNLVPDRMLWPAWGGAMVVFRANCTRKEKARRAVFTALRAGVKRSLFACLFACLFA